VWADMRNLVGKYAQACGQICARFLGGGLFVGKYAQPDLAFCPMCAYADIIGVLRVGKYAQRGGSLLDVVLSGAE
ncbi:hypothetical protein, partial [Corynebacterium lubricantis]|uniref:hypothetical protein n=1 Tax=Corynebacterium lubricantis TaxID=541095 RepID=UPI001B7FC8C2